MSYNRNYQSKRPPDYDGRRDDPRRRRLGEGRVGRGHNDRDNNDNHGRHQPSAWQDGGQYRGGGPNDNNRYRHDPQAHGTTQYRRDYHPNQSYCGNRGQQERAAPHIPPGYNQHHEAASAGGHGGATVTNTDSSNIKSEPMHAPVRTPAKTEAMIKFEENTYEENVIAQAYDPDICRFNTFKDPLEAPRGRKHFQDRTRDAVTAARRLVNRVFPARATNSVNDYEDDSDDSSGSFGAGAGCMSNEKRLQGCTLKEYLHFVECLPYFVFLDMGFHFNPKEAFKAHECVCPCAKGGAKFRGLFGVSSNDKLCTNKTGNFKGIGLISHLKSVAEVKTVRFDKVKGCLFHAATLTYLRYRYKDFWADDTDHKFVCEGINTNMYQRAERLEQVFKQKTIEDLQKRLAEAEERLVIKSEEQKKWESLCDQLRGKLKINPDEDETKDVTILEEREDAILADDKKKRRQGDTEYSKAEDVAVKIDMRNRLKENYARFYESMRRLNKAIAGEAISGREITIKVDQTKDPNDRINQFFSKGCKNWKNDKTFLFRSLSRYQKEETPYASLHLVHWDVVFSEVAKSEDNSMKAIDEGGPTRAFLTDVWNALSKLEVTVSEETIRDEKGENKKIENTVPLFEGRRLCIPIEDDLMKYNIKSAVKADESSEEFRNALGIVRRCYCAVGRILAHALATNDTLTGLKKKESHLEEGAGSRGATAIAGHVVPLLYRNKLFRRLEPKDSCYMVGDLIKHTAQLVGQNPDQEISLEKLMNMASMAHGFELTDEDMRLQFREWVQQYYIDDRQIALTALEEGLNLGGAVNVADFFWNVPLEALSKLVFTKDITKVEDVVAVMVGRVVSKSEAKSAKYVEVHHKMMTEVIPKVLEKLSQEDTEFLKKFLCFCIAEEHLADKAFHENFKILVEFNFDEVSKDHLPESHTCVNILKLPGEAYGGDAEIFEEKLRVAVESGYKKFTQA